MQVFHFLNEKYGLEALHKRRLKVSLIHELNDPFEFLAPRLSEIAVRQAFNALKKYFSERYGLICFSRAWTNPVLWSHYADRHRGVCLGFSFHDPVAPVKYSDSRLRVDIRALFENPGNEQLVLDCLCTNFRHWQYEKEVRAFVSLTEKDSDTGHYFFPFSECMTLNHVIIGAQSRISRGEVQRALGDGNSVCCFKARAAFQTFKVVRNLNEKLWH